MNKLSKEHIEKALDNSLYKIEVKDCVESTNTIMKNRAKEGADEFSVLIAAHQSDGRGRRGKTFYSPSGSGLYMSILLKPAKNYNPLHITTDAAVCCARVFEKLSGRQAQIKWVNDIYIDNKKVCGILTEGAVGENSYAVLGIGVNVTLPPDGFPDDIKNLAGSVFEEPVPNLRETVAAEILNTFIKIYIGGNRSEYLDEYRERSMVIGKEIEIIKNAASESGVALYVDDDYSLVVKKESGDICKLNSGEISIKMKQC